MMPMNAAPAPAPAHTPLAVNALLAHWRRAGFVAIGVYLLGFVGWATLAPISGAVVGSGLVKVEANRQTVTHRDGGIVAQVLVREGQTVARGQTLVVLEDARVETSVDLLAAQLDAERLRRSRLEAEAARARTWAPPAADAQAPARAREAAAREQRTFAARLQALDGQLAGIRRQLEDTDAEIVAHERNNLAAAEAVRLLRDETASNEALLQENFVNRTRVLTLRRSLAEYESRIQGTAAELAQARQRKAELAARVDALQLAYVQTATEELRETTGRIVEIEERLRAGQDAAQRQVVVAPVAGRLVDLRVNTVGSALGAREPIVDIVPTDAALRVEARVAADAIAQVRTGQPAEVRLLGIAKDGGDMLTGRVVAVSADALDEPRSGLPYFAVQVEVAPDPRHPAVLMPGVSAEVFIRTSERTALDFLLDPLLAGMRRSFREH